MNPKYLCRILAVLTLVLAGFVPSGQSQQSGTGSGQQPSQPTQPTSPTTPGGSTKTPTTPTIPGAQQPSTTYPSQQQTQPGAIFLSGRVLMEDGTPPPESVKIEMVCGSGTGRPQAYTDSKGRFSFQLGNTSNVLADASYSGAGPGSRGTGMASSGGTATRGMNTLGGGPNLMGCELRAAAPGYRSEVVNLGNRRTLDNPDVGTIILRRLGNVEGTTISATSLNAPKDAKKAFEKGRDAIKKQKWDEGRAQLEKAVAVYPKYASAWYELGTVYERNNQMEDARRAYGQSLAADAKYVNPYMRLAVIAAQEHKWQDVASTTDRLIKLNSIDFPAAYYFNSVAYFNLQNLDSAEKSAREAVKRDEQHHFPKVHHLLGIILAQKHDFAGASEYMKNYLKFAPNAADADAVKKQLAEVERILGAKATPPSAQQ